MDIGIVGKTTLKLLESLYWLFYLYIIKLTLFALKFLLAQHL